jgi:hypothetical protein
MSAYLVSVQDDKSGVLYPLIVGPFPDVETAEKFCDSHEMGQEAQNGQGGYSACHVIADETCHQSPGEYHDEWTAAYGDEEDESVSA